MSSIKLKRRHPLDCLIGLLSLLLPVTTMAVPDIQHWTTANGARVYFVPAMELPMVDVQVVFDAGSARDGEHPGLAQLTNQLLDSGTETLSADTVAERLDSVGAQLDGGAMRDMAWIALRSLVEPQYLTLAVDTVAQLLKEPVFAPESLERERNRMIAAVRERAQSPDAVAQLAFYQTLYAGHPYASPPEGTEESLKAITREQIKAFQQRYYGAANAVVAIVGALDRAGAERLVNQLLGELATGEAAPALTPTPALSEAHTVRIAHPSSQSHIYIGQVGVARGAPEYYSLYLGNHVLGGDGLVSTLAQEVREKRGLAYSAYSYFLPMRQAGPFVIGFQTRNDQVDQAIQIANTTLQDFINKGPAPNAFEEARQNITGGFPLRIDSNSDLVQHLAVIGFYKLPLDYLQTFTSKINALSPEQVSAAFRQFIHPQRLLTVIVGGS